MSLCACWDIETYTYCIYTASRNSHDIRPLKPGGREGQEEEIQATVSLPHISIHLYQSYSGYEYTRTSLFFEIHTYMQQFASRRVTTRDELNLAVFLSSVTETIEWLHVPEVRHTKHIFVKEVHWLSASHGRIQRKASTNHRAGLQGPTTCAPPADPYFWTRWKS